MEGRRGGRAQPEIPGEAGRDRVLALRRLTRAGAASIPDVNFRYGSEHAGLNQFHRPTKCFGGRPLIAHLCDHALLLC